MVEATPFDDSRPPGPMGLPEHLQVNFGVTDPADVQFGDPIVYIIPTDEYSALWDEAGNSVVGDRLAMLEELLADRPDLAIVRLPELATLDEFISSLKFGGYGRESQCTAFRSNLGSASK